ncbi:MAG: peptide-methionine (S)-S-oxide reductase MsrA [Verrucomicrobiota bacterium]|nr:peptide-methionine (S)-S-oxide reductase MsrA [Verrucomicrobiota bacterium]
MNTILKLFSRTILFCCAACGQADDSASKPAAIPKTVSKPSNEPLVTPPPKVGMITLGGGCFWCVEAVYQRIDGITKVISGYMGGTVPNPTYKQICTGRTGHAEVVKVEFDPAKITLEKVLAVFWKAHDPTTLNRQGADIGTQYRSAIFYHTDADKVVAEKSMKAAGSSGEFRSPIVTEITKASIFYKAEEYHQNYFNLNANAPYCRAVIWPKLRKLGLKFKKE